MGELWLQDPDVTLYHGDALETLRQLPDRSVHMVATSPPFYGLRDYAVEGQIGLEETPDQWVERLVAVFRECRRVLRDDGTLWVEIGDSYAAGGGNGGAGATAQVGNTLKNLTRSGSAKPAPGLKQKDLLGQPWLLAFALRADGWYLRSEIIWARPNPMPESVTDRPTKAHSTVFLLSKSPRYFYDADAIREPHTGPMTERRLRVGIERQGRKMDARDGNRTEAAWMANGLNPAGANARSVWTIPTEPTPFAHFATWPQQLVRRMIQAGTSERGCCPECGAPWVRDVETTKRYIISEGGSHADGTYRVRYADEEHSTDFQHPGEMTDEWHNTSGGKTYAKQRWHTASTTLGWSPSCHCAQVTHDGVTQPMFAPVPCTVLDPFAGSGTTCLVARNHGRHAIGIELNETYLKIAGQRLAQLSLLALEPQPTRLLDA